MLASAAPPPRQAGGPLSQHRGNEQKVVTHANVMANGLRFPSDTSFALHSWSQRAQRRVSSESLTR